MSRLGIGRDSFDIVYANVGQAENIDANCSDQHIGRRSSGTVKKISAYTLNGYVYVLKFYLTQESKLKGSFAANRNDLKTVKSAISCIRFLLINATRFHADETTFSTELQQLGLPTEHSTAICRVYTDQRSKIQEFLAISSLTGNFELIEVNLDTKNGVKLLTPTLLGHFKIRNHLNVI